MSWVKHDEAFGYYLKCDKHPGTDSFRDGPFCRFCMAGFIQEAIQTEHDDKESLIVQTIKALKRFLRNRP